MSIPTWPEGAERATATVPLRYEDISQDGRLLLEVAPHGVGQTVWRTLLPRKPHIDSLWRSGIIPILSRLVVVGGEGPHSVATTLEATASYTLAHSVDAN